MKCLRSCQELGWLGDSDLVGGAVMRGFGSGAFCRDPMGRLLT
jgi:hypothetical protein